MSNTFRFSRFHRRHLLVLVAATFTGLCSTLGAQTAPQLLPYTVKIVAGGGTTTIGKGATCPVSGFMSTDAYGDGCLATEIQLAAPRYATADVNGNVFFSDYTNGLIRRVDATTGIVTAVAGGVAYTASPSTSTAIISTAPAVCAAGSSIVPTDVKGDGCLGTQVFLANPTGLVFSPAGDLYFSEVGNSSSPQEKVFGADVRKIAATNGVITTTGVISTVDGALSSYYTYGYTANNYGATTPCSAVALTNCIVAGTSSYMDSPYGLAFDSNGNLYIAEEGKEAVLVVNTGSTATTVTGVTIPPGTVAKIAGATASSSTCPNGDTTGNGCTAGLFTANSSANSSEVHYPYAVAFDTAGNVYFANDYPYDIAKISTTGTITNYAGEENTPATLTKPVTTRGTAGSFAVGSSHGVAADTYANSNIYLTDSINGVVWRVDGVGQYMYPVAGGAKTICGAATDTYGDGCPATSAIFGLSSSGSTGLFGVSVDANANLYVGDSIINLVREVSSGTQFGPIGANQPTQNVDIHFAAGDSPSTLVPAFTLTSGTGNFSLSTPTCITNSDTTEDCILPITATPTVLGAFSGTLSVKSSLASIVGFPLSGTFVNSPLTRTVVTTSSAANCANNSTYSFTTPVTLTATVFSSGSPGGTVTFYANGTQIGNASYPVTNGVATLPNYIFSTPNSYALTAIYSGDNYYKTSTSAAVNITSATPTLSTQLTSYQSSTVVPGQTAIYSFNILQNDYSGTLTFSCSGLPANSSCVFSTSSIAANGCYLTNTIALSILTQQASSPIVSSFAGGRGVWSVLSLVCGVGLALLVGIRRRTSQWFGRICMMFALLLISLGSVACGSGAPAIQATPAGTYTITVTVTGSTGTTSTFTVPLIVS